MPCTLRRVFLRSINSSTVILGCPPWARVLCSRRSASVLLRLLQFFRQVRVSVVFVQRIATRRQSIAWGGRAVAEGPANQLALNLGPGRCLPEKFGIAQYHPAQSHEVDPPFAHCGLRYVRQEVLQVGVRRSDHEQVWEPPLELTG